MKPAPLQLTDYYLTSLELKANPSFDPKIQVPMDLESISIDHAVLPLEGEDSEKMGTEWQISLSIEQSIPEGKNIPYTFCIEIQGLVLASSLLTGDILDRAVQANGPAMLFGAAREIIRAATGRGPWAAVIIPSTNFLSLSNKTKTLKKTARKNTKKITKKAVRKRSK